ncbi:MAG: hypothetical protein ABSG02_17150 [Terriglobales bacterium]|jgi:hypothetical protein
MAANPTIVPQLKLALENKRISFSKPREASLNERIHNLLQEIFEGYEEYLGCTPD